jgi:hypothetical protein
VYNNIYQNPRVAYTFGPGVFKGKWRPLRPAN